MNTLHVTRWVLPGAIVAAALHVGCTTRTAPPIASCSVPSTAPAPPTTKPSAAAATTAYNTVEQVLAMPPCRATVEHRDEYSARFTTADGKAFVIGSDHAEQEIWHFVAHLAEGQPCELPAALVAFEKRRFYPSPEKIKAMPPCRATVGVEGPCFSVFNATDGKVFVIGDPGSNPIVYHFLRSLKRGQTYALPDAFVDYQKGHSGEEKEEN